MENTPEKPPEAPGSVKQKEASNRNALRHGLFSHSIVMDDELSRNLARLARQYRKGIRPSDAIELEFVEELTAAIWQMRRAWALATTTLNQGLPPSGPEDPSESLAAHFARQMQRGCESGLAESGTPGLAALLRHEMALRNKFYRILRNLKLLREMCAEDPAPPRPQSRNRNLRNEPGSAD